MTAWPTSSASWPAASITRACPSAPRRRRDDKTADIIVKVIDNAVSALLQNCHRNDAASHASSARSRRWPRPASQASASEFYGVGNSGIVAADAQRKFFRLGVHAAAIVDSH